MKQYLAAILLFLFTSVTMGKGDKPAYAIYNLKSKKVSYDKMIKDLATADVVLFGELHDNPICHWLEAEVMKDLYKAKGNAMVMGAEMFEADNQSALDSFLKSLYNDKEFAAAARLWPNYKTDYAALVEFARDKGVSFIASNIPRRFASKVYKFGFGYLDTLSDIEKTWLAPLPILYDSSLNCYQDIIRAAGGHGGPNLPKAQATKDATMAWRISQNTAKGKLFLHFNGSYHSDNFESMVWYLNKYAPNLKVLTISSVMQEDVSALQHSNKGKGNYTLAIPESMSRSY